MAEEFDPATADEAAHDALLGVLWKTAPDAIMVVDSQAIIRDFNPAGETIFGYSHDEMIGMPVVTILPDWRVWVDRLTAKGTALIDAKARAEADADLPVSLTLGRASSHGAEFIVCFARDQKRLEEMAVRLEAAQGELQQLMRLSTVNMMAGALAHDVNQPLTSASTYVQAADLMLAKDGHDAEAGVRTTLRSGLAEIQRAAAIIRQVRHFVNRREPERRTVSLNDVVRDASKVVGLGLAGDRIKLDLRLALGLPPVSVDPIQIQQVLFNLLRNAVEAMEETPRPRLAVETRVDGDHVVAIVSDTGNGIDVRVRDVLFTPFQTTKEQGLGLGLAICRTIVEAHGGTLEGTSQPEGGAAFTLRLPIADAAG